jgi:hypothetical protein
MGNAQYGHVLLIHPTIAVQRLREKRKVPDKVWDLYRTTQFRTKEATYEERMEAIQKAKAVAAENAAKAEAAAVAKAEAAKAPPAAAPGGKDAKATPLRLKIGAARKRKKLSPMKSSKRKSANSGKRV